MSVYLYNIYLYIILLISFFMFTRFLEIIIITIYKHNNVYIAIIRINIFFNKLFNNPFVNCVIYFSIS